MRNEELPIFELRESLSVLREMLDDHAEFEDAKKFYDGCYFQIINRKNELLLMINDKDFKSAHFGAELIYDYTLYLELSRLSESGKRFLFAAYGHNSTVSHDEIVALGLKYIQEMERFAEVWPRTREDKNYFGLQSMLSNR